MGLVTEFAPDGWFPGGSCWVGKLAAEGGNLRGEVNMQRNRTAFPPHLKFHHLSSLLEACLNIPRTGDLSGSIGHTLQSTSPRYFRRVFSSGLVGIKSGGWPQRGGWEGTSLKS